MSIKKDGFLHRADVFTDRGVVIELQNSQISLEEARQREDFYENMVWLFNAKDRKIELHKKSTKKIALRERKDLFIGNCYKWLYPSKVILNLNRPVLLNFENNLLLLRKTIGCKRLYFIADVIEKKDLLRLKGCFSEKISREDKKLNDLQKNKSFCI